MRDGFFLIAGSSEGLFIQQPCSMAHGLSASRSWGSSLFSKVAEYISGWTGRGLHAALSLYSNDVKREIYINVI